MAIRVYTGQLDTAKRRAFDQDFRPGRGNGPRVDRHRATSLGGHSHRPHARLIRFCCRFTEFANFSDDRALAALMDKCKPSGLHCAASV